MEEIDGRDLKKSITYKKAWGVGAGGIGAVYVPGLNVRLLSLKSFFKMRIVLKNSIHDNIFKPLKHSHLYLQ